MGCVVPLLAYVVASVWLSAVLTGSIDAALWAPLVGLFGLAVAGTVALALEDE